MDDLVSDFVIEASEGVATLQAALAALSVDASDREAARELLRRLHGVKGLCGFVGFARAETLAHAVEDLMQTALSEPGALAARSLIAATRAVERLGQIFAHAAEHRLEPEGDDAELIGTLEVLAAVSRAPEVESSAASSEGSSPSPLVTTRRDGERRVAAPWSGLDGLARSLADRLGKRIDLSVGGDDVRIGPQAAPALRTAMIALIRNACDHGIEPPAERRELGKPALAVIRVTVRRNGAGLAVDVADDGRGVDPRRIRLGCSRLAGLVAGELDSMPDQAVQELIFAPGVTTADALTPLSGRGLGLELVRTEVGRLGGSVVLDSVAGQGSRFTLLLPESVLASPSLRRLAAA